MFGLAQFGKYFSELFWRSIVVSNQGKSIENKKKSTCNFHRKEHLLNLKILNDIIYSTAERHMKITKLFSSINRHWGPGSIQQAKNPSTFRCKHGAKFPFGSFPHLNHRQTKVVPRFLKAEHEKSRSHEGYMRFWKHKRGGSYKNRSYWVELLWVFFVSNLIKLIFWRRLLFLSLF